MPEDRWINLTDREIKFLLKILRRFRSSETKRELEKKLTKREAVRFPC